MKKKTLFLFSLVIVLLVAFSTVTYAAFSEQYHPRISNFTFNVKTQEYMMISTTGKAGTFKDDISFNELIDSDKTYSLKPLYGSLNGEDIVIKNDKEESQNPSENTFIRIPVYFTASNDMNLYWVGSESGKYIEILSDNGLVFTDEQISMYREALRIGFVAYSINETVDGDEVKLSYSPLESNIYSFSEKTIDSYKDKNQKYETFYQPYTNGVKEDPVLLSVKANTISRMDIVIWIEAADNSIYDEDGHIISIFDIKLQVNLRFFAVNTEDGDE